MRTRAEGKGRGELTRLSTMLFFPSPSRNFQALFLKKKAFHRLRYLTRVIAGSWLNIRNIRGTVVILPKIYSYRVASSSQTWSSKFFLSILLLDLSFFFQHNSVLFELFIILHTHGPKERQSDNKLNRGITFYLIIAR